MDNSRKKYLSLLFSIIQDPRSSWQICGAGWWVGRETSDGFFSAIDVFGGGDVGQPGEAVKFTHQVSQGAPWHPIM